MFRCNNSNSKVILGFSMNGTFNESSVEKPRYIWVELYGLNQFHIIKIIFNMKLIKRCNDIKITWALFDFDKIFEI